MPTKSSTPEAEEELLNIAELKDKSIAALTKMAKELEIESISGLRKQELIFRILQKQTEKPPGLIFSEGVLEILPDGFGFLRAPDYNYLPGPDDVYVSPSQIRKFDAPHRRHRLRAGSSAEAGRALLRAHQGRGGQLRARFGVARRRARVLRQPHAALPRGAARVSRRATEELSTRSHHGPDDSRSARASAASSCRRRVPARRCCSRRWRTPSVANHPETSRSSCCSSTSVRRKSPTCSGRWKGEVVSSTFDEPPTRHVQVAEMVLEKAKRLVEYGKRRRDPPGLDHAPGARLQHRGAAVAARSCRVVSTPTPCSARSVSSARRARWRRAAP